MLGLNVIVTWDSYQALLEHDTWIFKSQTRGLNELVPNLEGKML